MVRRIAWPIGSDPGKWRSANVLLTTATHGAEATSRSSIPRPRSEPDAEGVEGLGVDLVEVGLRFFAGIRGRTCPRSRSGWVHTFMGRRLMMPARITPGSARTRSRTWS